MRKLLILIFVMMVVSSCWAPRCPMSTCHVRMEHQHDDLVTGVYSGRYLVPPRIHFLWERNKGEAAPDAAITPRGSKKTKKKYPWERW
jgi:hypothetical protein